MKEVRVQPDNPHWANVLLAISEGDLGPLALHLRESGGTIDPAVAIRLADLIDGTAATSAFELRLIRNSRLPASRSMGFERKLSLAKRDRDIATFVADYRFGKSGLHEAARKQAASEFRVSVGIVNRAWAKNGKDAQQFRAATERLVKLARSKRDRNPSDNR